MGRRITKMIELKKKIKKLKDELNSTFQAYKNICSYHKTIWITMDKLVVTGDNCGMFPICLAPKKVFDKSYVLGCYSYGFTQDKNPIKFRWCLSDRCPLINLLK